MGRPQALNARLVDSRWHLSTSHGALALNPDGAVAWRDAIEAAPRKQIISQFIGERFAVYPVPRNADELIRDESEDRLLRAEGPLFDDPENPARARFGYAFYVIDRETGSIVDRRCLAPLRRALNQNQSLHIDNHLALPFGDKTLLIPGAPEPDGLHSDP